MPKSAKRATLTNEEWQARDLANLAKSLDHDLLQARIRANEEDMEIGTWYRGAFYPKSKERRVTIQNATAEEVAEAAYKIRMRLK